MNVELMKNLGNMEQIAGIRESSLLYGPCKGLHLAEFYNAAGLTFSVVPDRCMDVFDFRYKGVNFAFQSKNGLTAPQENPFGASAFTDHWPGGMVVTCGLDNVGLACQCDDTCPTHGRISNTPASRFGTDCRWEGEEYVLSASGEVHDTQMYGHHLSLRRTVSTTLNSKTLTIRDTVTNHDFRDQPYMLLYHCNFGYPLLQAETAAAVSSAAVECIGGVSGDTTRMAAPADGGDQELYLHTGFGKTAAAVLWNPALGLGACVHWDTTHLPNMCQWKHLNSHDYVTAFEPCNTGAENREGALEKGTIAVLPAYSSIDVELELTVLDGEDDLNACLAANGLKL